MEVTVVGMIYKSPSYLDFMMRGIQRYGSSAIHNVDYLIVANDATPTILEKLKTDRTYHVVYTDYYPNDFYITRVYRAWNFGGKAAKGDVIVFINSDMAFTPNWLDRLLENLTPHTIPCSLLVESGKLASGLHAISKDFGRRPDQFRETEFLQFAQTIQSHKHVAGGLFMPCAFYKKDFIESGGYPEGNVYENGVFKFSGDHYFFYENQKMKTKQHVTILDSIVYHIQEGEKDYT